MRDFNLGRRFDLITIAGNSFQALLNEEYQINCLRNIAENLEYNGYFILSTRNTISDEMRTTEDFEFWHHFKDENGRLVNVYGKQNFNPSINILHFFTKHIWSRYETISEISLKFTDSLTLLALLETSNLKILEVYGDFKKETSDFTTSDNIVLICTKI